MDGEKGYATSDLFIPHPTVPGFWKMYALSLCYSQRFTLSTHMPTALEGKTMSSSTPLERRLSQRPWRTSSLTAPSKWIFDPIMIYSDLTYSNSVMGVVMFGREHDQPGVLIELKGPYAIDASIEAEVIKARNLVW
jgi:hypothetical protein